MEAIGTQAMKFRKDTRGFSRNICGENGTPRGQPLSTARSLKYFHLSDLA